MTQRVLILEDQAFQRGFLANLFGSRADVQVDACEDVEAAIALCACQPYDLVVSDLLMPGQDGIQFIQALAAQPRPPRLAVVSAAPRRMMTSARLMAESLGLDVIGLLPKPVAAADVDALFEALAQARPAAGEVPARAPAAPEPDASQLRQAMADGSLTAWFSRRNRCSPDGWWRPKPWCAGAIRSWARWPLAASCRRSAATGWRASCCG